MRRWAMLTCLGTSIAATMAAPAAATEVLVHVPNVGDAAGRVRVEVCRAGEWLKDGCVLRANAPARAGLVVVTVRDVPPGTYAVVAHHDRDDDTEVNRNFLGVPTEGVGFSRGPSILFGAPTFADSAMTVAGERAMVEVRLLFE